MTRVLRNDWSILSPPAIGAWTPTRSVSVIIPAYNCQASLDLVLAALSRQTYPDQLLEVIVVDDGSTDESRSIIESYGDRVIPVLQPNGGQASAFNAGFAVGLVKRFDIETTVRFAQATAALNATGLGSQAGVESFEHTLRFAQTATTRPS